MRVEVDRRVARAPEQHRVVARALDGVREQRAVRERVEERRDLALHRFVAALVELQEHGDDAAFVQPRLAELPELARVERRRAFHPRVERVGRDRVELLVRGREQVPAVVDANLDFRVRDDAEVVLARNTRAATRGTSGSISATTTRSTAGSTLTAPAVMPAPRPITSTDRGFAGDERRDVAEHPLQAQVLRIGRRLRLAGVVVGEHAVGSRVTAIDAVSPSPT